MGQNDGNAGVDHTTLKSEFALQIDRTVIVDAGAAIKLERIEKLGNEFITTPEVYAEIKDFQARKHLLTLPFELKVKQPTENDFRFARQFAKQTGDFGFLSTNDLGLIALAINLHKERQQPALRMTPELSEQTIKENHQFSWAPLVDTVDTSCDKENASSSTVDTSCDFFNGKQMESVPELEELECPEEEKENQQQIEDITKKVENCTITKEAPKQKTETLSVVSSSKIMNSGFGESIAVEVSDDEDDEGGWVTVDNLHRLKNVVNDTQAENEPEFKVCILSTDYSVQNVSIQMGLKAISCDGFRIRTVKLWAKICRACFASTRDTEKRFCPKCGNITLDRCPMSLDNEGKMVLHDNRTRRPNLRGTIFSIPKWKTGRNANNMILSEDEMMMGGRARELKNMQKIAERQKQIKDPFLDKSEGLDNWASRAMTSSGKYINGNPHGFNIGRRDPNYRRDRKTNNKK